MPSGSASNAWCSHAAPPCFSSRARQGSGRRRSGSTASRWPTRWACASCRSRFVPPFDRASRTGRSRFAGYADASLTSPGLRLPGHTSGEDRGSDTSIPPRRAVRPFTLREQRGGGGRQAGRAGRRGSDPPGHRNGPERGDVPVAVPRDRCARGGDGECSRRLPAAPHRGGGLIPPPAVRGLAGGGPWGRPVLSAPEAGPTESDR